MWLIILFFFFFFSVKHACRTHYLPGGSRISAPVLVPAVGRRESVAEPQTWRYARLDQEINSSSHQNPYLGSHGAGEKSYSYTIQAPCCSSRLPRILNFFSCGVLSAAGLILANPKLSGFGQLDGGCKRT